jgi:hypothetical protein
MGREARTGAEGVGLTRVEAAENAEEHIVCVSLRLCFFAVPKNIWVRKIAGKTGGDLRLPPVC